MPNDINYYYIATLLIVVITIFYVYNATVNYFGFKQRQTYVDKHINYIAILDYYMEKAFDIIYKDRMLVYSIEGSKPSDEDVKTNTIDFTKLALQLLGPNLVKEFVFLYGDEETLYLIMAEFFNTRAEQDEIKQESINNMMDQDQNETL